MPNRRRTLLAALAVAPLLLGCMFPGGFNRAIPADLATVGLTPERRAQIAGYTADPHAAPQLRTPAVLAVAHVQEGWFDPRDPERAASPPLARPCEPSITPDHLIQLRNLPGVLDAFELDDRLLPRDPFTGPDLLDAARRAGADVLLVYTFRTAANSDDKLPIGSLVTLGTLPASIAQGETRIDAALIDPRTGYVFGMATTHTETRQLANAWSADDAEEDTRRRAESRALARLLEDLTPAWRTVLTRFAQR